VWVSDHIALPAEGPLAAYPYASSSQPPFDASTPFLEPLCVLSFVAGVTQTLQLATGVVVLPLRHPLLTAKQVATVDVLSGGRALLGVGSGWLQDEFSLLGSSWEDRGERTDLGIATLRACWGDRPTPLPGDVLGRAVSMHPRPVQGVGLPVLIGGHSPAAMRRAVALGDGWYASNVDGPAFASLVESLRRLESESSGRRELLVGVRPGVVDPGDASACLESVRAAGADFVVLDAPYASTTEAEAEAWVHRTADALGLGDGVKPLRSRRVWSVAD
jgi:probable F420-dependent oxidoreductase